MPKVTYTPSSGLIQAAGSGVNINSILGGQSGEVNLDSKTFLTVFTGASSGGDVTLPASADTGAIKIIMADTAANVVINGTNCSTGNVTMTNVGDFVVAVFNGTEWIVGRSLT